MVHELRSDSGIRMAESDSLPLAGLKVISWNINGIRTVKNLKQLLDELDADIICLQETKVTRDMIDEPTALVEGYNAYFSFSRARSGYSGVATFCRERATPLKAEEGLSGTLQSTPQPDSIGCLDGVECEFSPQELKKLDSEGRAVITQHKVKIKDGSEGVVTIFNVYCPRGDPERPERLEFKQCFNRLLELRAQAVHRSRSMVMIVGDINISHRPIDRCENVDPAEFDGNPSRQWLNSFLLDTSSKSTSPREKYDGLKVIDSFRYYYPNKENMYTCWNTKVNARATNYGSRIDYIFVDELLVQNMVDSLILSEVQGSDHCPVSGIFDAIPVKASRCPSACTKNFPEFSGVQQKLSVFFTKKPSGTDIVPEIEANPSKRKTLENDPKHSESKNGGILKKPKMQGQAAQKQISSFFQKTPQPAGGGTDSSSSVSSSQGSQDSVSSSVTVGSQGGSDDAEELSTTVLTEKIEKNSSVASAWRSMLKGPRPPPLCQGHKEPCVERTVKKKGPNFNRKFYSCARGEGNKTDPRARCDHFEWAVKK